MNGRLIQGKLQPCFGADVHRTRISYAAGMGIFAMSRTIRGQPDRCAHVHSSDQVRFCALRLFAAWIEREVADLDPGCFALVMATGIISNGFFLEEQRELSDVLLAVNLAAYCWLCVATLLRAIRFTAALWADVVNPRLVFSFFTFVAATDVLALGIDLRGFATAALCMWLAALAIWLMLSYLGFGVLTFLNDAGGAKVIDGGWLNAIVGTQSLVILGAQAALLPLNAGATVSVLIHMLWTVGLGLYAILIVLLCYRMFFAGLRPDDINPQLWVIMGAAAISTNAGSNLVTSSGGMAFLLSIKPFIDGVTLAMWAWATWWIPLLVLLGIWKHGVHRVPIRYTTTLWSMVFPLGMYAVASHRLALVAELPALQSLSRAMVWIALAAWGATGIGLVIASWHSARAFLHRAQLFGSMNVRAGQ
jgi:tellurite resistance protein TehA-like permease